MVLPSFAAAQGFARTHEDNFAAGYVPTWKDISSVDKGVSFHIPNLSSTVLRSSVV